MRPRAILRMTNKKGYLSSHEEILSGRFIKNYFMYLHPYKVQFLIVHDPNNTLG
jgi:hypothetical protein